MTSSPVPAQPADDDVLGRDHRTRPRRRGDALESAILDAAAAELTEVGYERLSMERVAERARTGKASVYRRWPDKLHLAAGVFYHLIPREMAEPADTGSLRGDLVSLFGLTAATLDGPAGWALRGLLSDVVLTPDLGARFRALTRGSSLQVLGELVERARRRGELGDGPISVRQLDAGLSVLRFHILIHGSVSTETIAEMVDDVVLPLLRAAAGPARR